MNVIGNIRFQTGTGNFIRTRKGQAMPDLSLVKQFEPKLNYGTRRR